MSAPTTMAVIASTYSATPACLLTASLYLARCSRARPAPPSGPRSGAAVVKLELDPGADRVPDVRRPGCLDHADRGELDALVSVQPEAGVEQPHAVAEQHRGDMQ